MSSSSGDMDGPRIEIVDENADNEAVATAAAASEKWASSVTLTEDDGCVYAKFPIPSGVTVKGRNADILVEWAERKLKIGVKSTGATLIEGPLRHPIKVPVAGSNKWDSCETRWFVEDDKWFVVQLEKVDKTLEWRRLFTTEYYAELAEAGNVAEQINMAIQMDQANKPEEGFKWWKRAADQGNPNAQTIVGSKYQEGIGTSKDEEKSQEYYIKAALNPTPHPLAMLTVGWWLREGTLGNFGKQVMMGYTHRQIWERCVQMCPGHKQALMCAQLLAQEYLQEGNMQKAEFYARAGGAELRRDVPAKAQQQQKTTTPTSQRARPAKLESLPPMERIPEGSSLIQEANGATVSLQNYNFWSTAAWCAIGVATALVLYRTYKSSSSSRSSE